MNKLFALLLLFGIVGCGPNPVDSWEVAHTCNGSYSKYAQCRNEKNESECDDEDLKWKAQSFSCALGIEHKFLELNTMDSDSKVFIECDTTPGIISHDWQLADKFVDSRDTTRSSYSSINIPTTRQYFQYCKNIDSKEKFERELRLLKFMNIENNREILKNFSVNDCNKEKLLNDNGFKKQRIYVGGKKVVCTN